MRISRSVIAPALGLALLFLQGCAAWQVNQIANQLPTLGPANALQQLEKIQPSDRDRAQYLLNRGTLKFYNGDLAGSRADLSEAQQIMASLQATSLVENFASVSANETLRSYTGTPSDQVMVHVLLALTYLCAGDVDGARVEMLQSQVEMQRLAKEDSSSGQLALARFVAGVVYELNREWDDALISYRQAYGILKQRGQAIPLGLQDSLLMLAQRQNRQDDINQYKTEFGHTVEVPARTDGELFLIYLDGVVSTKTEARISVVAGENAQLISVVVPSYPPARYVPTHLVVQAGAARQSTQIVEDMEARARDDLSDDMTRIMATATTRAVAKYNLVNEAQNKSDMAGLIANIATFASEQADVRSWNMLPSNFQIARVTVPQGGQISIPPRAGSMNEFPLQAAMAGRKVVVVLNSLTPLTLSYPVAPAAESVAPTDVSTATESNAPTATGTAP